MKLVSCPPRNSIVTSGRDMLILLDDVDNTVVSLARNGGRKGGTK